MSQYGKMAILSTLMMAGMASNLFDPFNKNNREEIITVHCRVCGKLIDDTKSGDNMCNGECRKAYKNEFLKAEIREKSEWKLVNRKWEEKEKKNV